jgi:hypothetical protein
MKKLYQLDFLGGRGEEQIWKAYRTLFSHGKLMKQEKKFWKRIMLMITVVNLRADEDDGVCLGGLALRIMWIRGGGIEYFKCQGTDFQVSKL